MTRWRPRSRQLTCTRRVLILGASRQIRRAASLPVTPPTCSGCPDAGVEQRSSQVSPRDHPRAKPASVCKLRLITIQSSTDARYRRRTALARALCASSRDTSPRIWAVPLRGGLVDGLHVGEQPLHVWFQQLGFSRLTFSRASLARIRTISYSLKTNSSSPGLVGEIGGRGRRPDRRFVAFGDRRPSAVCGN